MSEQPWVLIDQSEHGYFSIRQGGQLVCSASWNNASQLHYFTKNQTQANMQRIVNDHNELIAARALIEGVASCSTCGVCGGAARTHREKHAYRETPPAYT